MTGPLEWRVLTPPGRGAIAIVGIRGPDLALGLASLLEPPVPGGGPRHVRVRDASGAILDDAMWIPLGETRGLLTLHGNPVLLDRLAERLGELGAREGADFDIFDEDGSDALHAEAAELLAAAPTLAGAHFLLAQADLLEEWTRRGEGTGAPVPEPDLRAALDRYPAARPFERTPTVVLAGVPNAGKSTLFNRLLGRARVVVDPTPGTTRDRIEERGVLADRPIRWVDGAGLREGDSPVERAGVERMRAAIERADLVVLLVPPDGTEPRLPADLAPTVLRIRSWADQIHPETDADPRLAVSGLTGEGIDALGGEIARRLFGGRDLPAEITPFTGRQVRLLREILECRREVRDEAAAWKDLRGSPPGS